MVSGWSSCIPKKSWYEENLRMVKEGLVKSEYFTSSEWARFASYSKVGVVLRKIVRPIDNVHRFGYIGLEHFDKSNGYIRKLRMGENFEFGNMKIRSFI